MNTPALAKRARNLVSSRPASSTFPSYLRARGYDEHGVRRGIDPRRHLYRLAGNAPALNSEVVSYWRAHDVKVLRAELTDDTFLTIPLETFVKNAWPLRHDEPQLVAHRSKWREHDCRQTSLLDLVP